MLEMLTTVVNWIQSQYLIWTLIKILVITIPLITAVAFYTYFERKVIGAMQKLKKNERDILALAISDGLSYRDIAAIVDISVENVKVKVHRTRLKLKKILQRGDES